MPRFTPEALAANQAIVELVNRLPERKKLPRHISLWHGCWLWIAPIPGTRTLHCLQEKIGAIDVAITAGEVKKINEASSKIELTKERYPEVLERSTGL